MKCKKCGYEWHVVASSLLLGYGCPKCAGTKKKTHDEFVKELSIMKPGIIVKGKYVNAKERILSVTYTANTSAGLLTRRELLGYG